MISGQKKICHYCKRWEKVVPRDLSLIRNEEKPEDDHSRSTSFPIETAVQLSSADNLELIRDFLIDLSASLQSDAAGEFDFRGLTIAFNNEDNSIGFGVKRRNTTTFYPKLFNGIGFKKGVPLHYTYGFRGCFSSLTFRWQSAVISEPSPKRGQYLNLKRAARHAITAAKSTSLVRKTIALVSNVNSSDFDSLILGPSISAMILTGQDFVGEAVYPLSGPLLPYHPRSSPLLILRRFWSLRGQLERSKVERHQKLLSKILSLIIRYDSNEIQNELLRFIFYSYSFLD